MCRAIFSICTVQPCEFMRKASMRRPGGTLLKPDSTAFSSVPPPGAS